MKNGLLWVLKALLSHYWRHPWQTVFLLTGLVSGVGLWSAVQIINQQAESSYQQAQSLLGVQANYWIQSRSESGVEQMLYIELRRKGFRQIFPVVEFEASTKEGKSVNIIATDLLALSDDVFSQSDSSQSSTLDWVKFVQPPYQAWYPPELAKEFNIESNQLLVLRDGRVLPPALLQSREQQGRRIFLDIAAAFELTGKQEFSYLAVGDISIQESVEIASHLPGHLQMVENHQHIDLQQLTDSLHTHLTAMSLLSFAVGLFIVFNAVRFSIWYRRQTILVLRSLGCSVGQIIIAIGVETLVWSILGSMLGFALGFILAQILLPGFGSSLQSLFSANIDTVISLRIFTFAKAWAITLIGLTFALFWPMYQQLKHHAFKAASSDQLLNDEKKDSNTVSALRSVIGLARLVCIPSYRNCGAWVFIAGVDFVCSRLGSSRGSCCNFKCPYNYHSSKVFFRSMDD